MKSELPEYTVAQLHRLIEEGLPPAQIAFMMRLSRTVVDAEIERFNTTREPAVAARR